MKKKENHAGYCMRCGQKMAMVGHTAEFIYYDSLTGEKTAPLEVWQCPSKRWWNTHNTLARRESYPTGLGLYL